MTVPEWTDLYGRRYTDAALDAASGTPVVGLIGAEIPGALVSAAGARPLRLHADPGVQTAQARGLLGEAIDEPAVLILGRILEGLLDFLRGILVANDSEASLRLFYALRELNRLGRVTIPVHLVDQRHLDRPSTLRYNVFQLQEAARLLGTWTTRPVTADSLRSSVEDADQLDRVLAGLRARRRSTIAPISGIDALHAYGLASALPPRAAVHAIDSAALTAEPTRSADPPLRLFCSGSAPIGDRLYRVIESCGAVVVAEDHDWGDLSSAPTGGPRAGGLDDGLAGLAAARLSAPGSAPTRSADRRARHAASAVEASAAQAVLSIVREHDEAPAWDFPRVQHAVAVPSVLLERQALTSPVDVSNAIARLRSMP